MPNLRIGSRGSQLALWQANHISALLRARGHEVEIEIIHTTGDKITDVPLAMVGTKGGLGKGIFTKEIEEDLAAGRVDLAVHSLKDLPTELAPGFEIAAITERQDPRDAFCSAVYSRVEDLPGHARVGTSSLRRQAQLKATRPDLDIHPLRGNVDTRLRKLEQGEYDAIILATAGLKRLDARGVHHRDRELHVARASRRQTRGCAVRHFLVRFRDVRNADGPTGIRRAIRYLYALLNLARRR
jgi:hydroxymethylbilane synthase